MRLALLLPFLLVAGVARGTPIPPFLDAAFGPPVADLRLAVTVDADVATAELRIQNVGKRPATFTKEYSCSGLSPFSISMGMTAGALDAAYGFEPKVNGLSRKLETVCTRNVPKKRVTVAPGATIAIVVPFAIKGDLITRTETVFQANAALDIDDRSGLVVLHSALVERPKRRR